MSRVDKDPGEHEEMKSCPRCGRKYTDDLAYCLEDGSMLVPIYDQTETPTVVRLPATTAPAAARRSRAAKYIAFTLIALVSLALAGAVGAYFVWTRLVADNRPAERTSENTAPTPTPARRTPQAPSPTAKREPEDWKTEAVPEPPVGPPREQFNDPGTSRITFRRGRVNETVTGRISRERNFVLRTMAGQQLSSTVSSDDGCVAFSEGGTQASFPAPAGDAVLSLINQCPAPSAFRMTVTVR